MVAVGQPQVNSCYHEVITKINGSWISEELIHKNRNSSEHGP